MSTIKLNFCNILGLYVCPYDFKKLELPPCLGLSEHLQSLNLQNPGSQTPTPPPSHLINFSFSSVMQGSFEIHGGCIILVRPFLHSIS